MKHFIYYNLCNEEDMRRVYLVTQCLSSQRQLYLISVSLFILVLALPLIGMARDLKSCMSEMIHRVDDSMTIADNLGMGLKRIRGMTKGKIRERVRECLDLVELEVRDLLTEYEFPGDDIPVVRGSALKALDEGDEVAVASIFELMDAVDSYIPEPVRETDKPFMMAIEDVFSITGRGTVVTGRIETGVVHVGEAVEIVGLRDLQNTTVTGVEMFRKLLDEGQAGDNVGLLLRGIGKDEVERGQVVAKPGSITPHTEFDAQVYVLTKEEGGRHNPFFDGYRPQFYFQTTDVTGTVSLPSGTEMVMPGDNTEMTVELIHTIAMDEGQRFAIREGGRTVGAGRVTKINK